MLLNDTWKYIHSTHCTRKWDNTVLSLMFVLPIPLYKPTNEHSRKYNVRCLPNFTEWVVCYAAFERKKIQLYPHGVVCVSYQYYSPIYPDTSQSVSQSVSRNANPAPLSVNEGSHYSHFKSLWYDPAGGSNPRPAAPAPAPAVDALPLKPLMLSFHDEYNGS